MALKIDFIRDFCLGLKGVEETLPFGPDVLVFKVRGKVFALLPLDGDESVNLKCDPEKAIELRREWEEIQPGYHMNKKHWNTLQLSGRLKPSLVKELIQHSYDLVVASLPKKEREALLRA